MVIQRLLQNYIQNMHRQFSAAITDYHFTVSPFGIEKHKRTYQQKKAFPTLKELFISVTMKHIYMTHILSNKCT